MLEWLELEEQVGRVWHRLVGERFSYPRHPEAAITLSQVRGTLAVFFHGLGGGGGVQVAAIAETASTHRLSFTQRIGMNEEKLPTARLDQSTLSLPARLDLFAEAELNRRLYFWLAAFLSKAWEERGPAPAPTRLAADIAFLARARRVSVRVLADFPGLAPIHARLCAALAAIRPRRPLPPVEAEIEAAVQALLGGPEPDSALWRLIADGQGEMPAEPLRYRPFLPVPLWGEALDRAAVAREEDEEDDDTAPPSAQAPDQQRRKAERKNQDQAERDDPLILNRFEKILSLADMVNVNRGKEEDDEEDAKKAADDLETITLAKNQKKVATRLRLDLDLAPAAVSETVLTGRHLYPEWDWRQGLYHPDHCAVVASIASEEGEDWQPDALTRRRIRRVQRQFEAMRPRPVRLTRQADGDDLDLEAVVRSRSDLAATGVASDRLYTRMARNSRDLSVALLLDASLSTDSWVENRRVMDIAKEALSVFAHGVDACGDEQAIFAFTSRKRDWVKVETIKDFDEPLSGAVMRRIGALKPGYYTRIGAAIRHVTKQLEDRPHRHRLLLLLTDGKPNDIDHYEGRYGVEDSRKAVREARRRGLSVFGLTIDSKAQDYFPAIFGRGAFTIIDHPARLSSALPRIYRQVTG